MDSIKELKLKIESFKKRYHTRQLVVGILGFLMLNTAVFLAFASLEAQLWFGVVVRSFFFFVFLILIISSFYLLIFKHFLILIKIKKGLSNEEAAKEISNYFSEIDDKLINTLQLGEQKDNELLSAAIDKKSTQFKQFSFVQAVDLKTVKQYSFACLGLLIVFALVSFISPSSLIDSHKRIINFTKEYEKEMPFKFVVENADLSVFKGEDLQLNIRLAGEILPEKVKLIVDNSNRIPISIPLTDAKFSYLFSTIQSQIGFQLEAAGFRSQKYVIRVNERPNLVSMFIRVLEPEHTGGKRKSIENTGNLIIPEGSSVLWTINTLATNSTAFIFNEEKKNIKKKKEQVFNIEKQIFSAADYTIELYNEFSKNKSKLNYTIDVIKDEYPKIVAQYFSDSTTFRFLTFSGTISDDYGLASLQINYKKLNSEEVNTIPLEINKKVSSQSFFAQWNLDTLNLKAGESLEVYLSVFDNDGINGAKESRSPNYILKNPTDSEISSLISDKESQIKNNLDESRKKTQEIVDQLEAIENRLKSERNFDWKDKKLLKELIKDREALEKQIEQLKKEHEDLNESNNKFNKHSEQVQKKNTQMQKFLDKLLDEETQKLYEKIKKLMDQKSSSDEVRKELSDIKKKERNLEKDLERVLELFKRLKMESALEENLETLDKISKKQEKIVKESENKERQEEINKEFDNFRKKMDEVEQLNQDLKKPEALEGFDLEERQIAKILREIMEQMEKQGDEEKEKDKQGDNKKGKNRQENEKQEDASKNKEERGNNPDTKKRKSNTQKKQKEAAKKMKSLTKKLSKMQGGMQMEMMQVNLDQLREILDNLIKLSFNQEKIMQEMRQVNQSDPRFLTLSQDQLRLKENSKVIQDSLLSLASRVVQISSFVTREVGLVNEKIDDAIAYLKERNRRKTLSSQQFAMTSINNLALLLDNSMQQMQMTMAESMGKNSFGPKQPSKNGLSDFQELQNQLGKKINKLKGSKKTGRQLSESLAKLAAEQEFIRQQMNLLKESQDGKPGGMGGDNLKKAIEMMEQNEIDLVNKRLTQQLINRQKQIKTRMLEAEKAQREDETEEKREAQQSKVISQKTPPSFEEFLKLNKKEIELLKTIPLELTRFYKQEVNTYFRRLSSKEEND